MKKAKLFKNGQSQAVRLPKDFQFKGTEVLAQKLGNAILLVPTDNPWELFKSSLNEFTEDFMVDRNQKTHDKRDSFE